MDKKALKAARKAARKALDELQQKRKGLADAFEAITTGAVDDKGEARGFTAEEAENRGRIKAELASTDEQVELREDEVRKTTKELRKLEQREAIAQTRRELGLADVPANAVGGSVAVIHENRTYERGNGVSYLQDLVFRAMGPGMGPAWSRACERLARHSHENHVEALEVDTLSLESRGAAKEYFRRQMIEQANLLDGVGPNGFPVRQERGQAGFGASPGSLSYRALSTATTAGGEFVPPLFLTQQWIEFLRAARVFANCQHHEDLPDGTMSINIPKVTGGTAVGMQTNQNTNIAFQDLQTQFVTFPVVTFAGGQVVSLQLLERSPIAFDDVVMKDLAKAHAQKVDQQCLAGLGGAGEVVGVLNTTGVNTITWTQGTPTVKGFYGRLGVSKVAIYEGGAAAGLAAKTPGLYMPATHAIMSGDCWEWIGQSFDTQERPLVVPDYNGPFNAVQIAPDTATAEGAIGRNLSGLATFEDANLPNEEGSGKNQDVAVIGRFDENYLYESPVVTRALPQTYGAQLSVLLQLYNYGAYTAARYPNANAIITGTGMARSNRTFNS